MARLALEGSCHGCSASRATLELAIKQALDEHAPDLAGLEVEGVSEAEPPAPSGWELPLVHSEGPGLELPLAGGDAASAPGLALPLAGAASSGHQPRWIALDGVATPAPGGVLGRDVAGVALLMANVGGTLLAYRDECAACGGPLHDAALDGPLLRCPACEVEFDLPRAGRAAGAEPLQLTPVPLLAAGGLRVAL